MAISIQKNKSSVLNLTFICKHSLSKQNIFHFRLLQVLLGGKIGARGVLALSHVVEDQKQKVGHAMELAAAETMKNQLYVLTHLVQVSRSKHYVL